MTLYAAQQENIKAWASASVALGSTPPLYPSPDFSETREMLRLLRECDDLAGSLRKVVEDGVVWLSRSAIPNVADFIEDLLDAYDLLFRDGVEPERPESALIYSLLMYRKSELTRSSLNPQIPEDEWKDWYRQAQYLAQLYFGSEMLKGRLKDFSQVEDFVEALSQEFRGLADEVATPWVRKVLRTPHNLQRIGPQLASDQGMEARPNSPDPDDSDEYEIVSEE